MSRHNCPGDNGAWEQIRGTAVSRHECPGGHFARGNVTEKCILPKINPRIIFCCQISSHWIIIFCQNLSYSAKKYPM